MDAGDLCRVPVGESGKCQGRDRVGIVKRSHVYLARGISVRGKFVLARNPGYKTSGVAMWLNVRSSDPPGSLSRSQSSGMGPSASCGHCCPLSPTWGQYSGKFVLSSPRR